MPPPNNTPIKTSNTNGNINNQPIAQVLSNNFNRLNNGNALALDSAFNELSYSVLNNNALTVITSNNNNLADINMLYTMLTDAYNYIAFENDSLTMATHSQTERIMPYYAQMNTTMQQLWAHTADTNSLWHDIKYHIAIDWAQVHRTANNRVEALNVLNATEIEITNPIENIGLNKWKCINQMEMAL